MFIYDLSGCGFESRCCNMSSSFSIYVIKCNLWIVHVVTAHTYSKSFFYLKQQCRDMSFAVLTVFILIEVWFWYIFELHLMLGWLKQKGRTNYIYNSVHYPDAYSESSETCNKKFFDKKRLAGVNNLRK